MFIVNSEVYITSQVLYSRFSLWKRNGEHIRQIKYQVKVTTFPADFRFGTEKGACTASLILCASISKKNCSQLSLVATSEPQVPYFLVSLDYWCLGRSQHTLIGGPRTAIPHHHLPLMTLEPPPPPPLMKVSEPTWMVAKGTTTPSFLVSPGLLAAPVGANTPSPPSLINGDPRATTSRCKWLRNHIQYFQK